MRGIINGVHRFQNDCFLRERSRFEALATGQNPLALMITCADSRIDPCMLTGTKPGELFVLRTAGNIVPPYGAVYGGEAATIEYAVEALKISDIIICGHSHCGAMQGLLDPASLQSLPAVKAYLQYAEVAAERVTKDESSDASEKLRRVIETNVLIQLENLTSHPTVKQAVDAGKLQLHGWVYQFESGDVYAFQQQTNQFQSIRDVH